MSNLAQKNIYKPQTLFFETQQFRQATLCWVSGSYNTFRVKIPTEFGLEILKEKIRFKPNSVKMAFSFYKTNSSSYAKTLKQKLSLLYVYMNQWIMGNLVGFQNALRVRGVGYKFNLSTRKLIIQAGYSHLLFQELPLISPFQTMLLNKKAVQLYMQGFNLMRLNLYVSSIRNLRQPDVYKGKGIRYKKDFLMRKEGKKKKT